ncbi:MAG: hypothetical protein AAFO29_06430 [Actinomycetota bacterium]
MESTDRHDDAGRAAAQSDLALLDNASKAVRREAVWPRINPLVGCLVPLVHLSLAAFIRGTFRWVAAVALVALFGAALYLIQTRLQVRAKPDPKRHLAVSLLFNITTIGTFWPWGDFVAYAPSGMFLQRAAVAYPLTAVVFVGVFALVNYRRPGATLT